MRRKWVCFGLPRVLRIASSLSPMADASTECSLSVMRTMRGEAGGVDLHALTAVACPLQRVKVIRRTQVETLCSRWISGYVIGDNGATRHSVLSHGALGRGGLPVAVRDRVQQQAAGWVAWWPMSIAA